MGAWCYWAWAWPLAISATAFGGGGGGGGAMAVQYKQTAKEAILVRIGLSSEGVKLSKSGSVPSHAHAQLVWGILAWAASISCAGFLWYLSFPLHGLKARNQLLCMGCCSNPPGAGRHGSTGFGGYGDFILMSDAFA